MAGFRITSVATLQVKPEFDVRIESFHVLDEIQGVWGDEDFLALLDEMEYGDTSGLEGVELREMCVLSLQDLDPEDAAALLLRHKLGGRLSAGQIQNIASDMLEEKMWEEYADMALHEQMFTVGSFLYKAFPRAVPEPDAVQVSLQIKARNEDAQALLENALAEPLLVRLLADGMDGNAVLHRMFGEKLAGRSFPEASTIVWIVETAPLDDGSLHCSVISSGYWLDPLRGTRSFSSTARPDGN